MVPDAPLKTAQRSTPSGGTTARRSGWVAVALVRVTGVVLLAMSVVYGWRSTYARFGVCFGADTPPVDLEEPLRASACEYMQSDTYDQVMPSDPWVPIADVARLEGLSLMTLGVGLAVVSLSLAGRWWFWLLSVAGGVGVGAVWVGIGVPVWRTALAGERVGYEGYMAAIALTLGTVLVTAALAVLSWYRGGRDGKLYAVFWAAMTVAQPLPEVFITLALWPSHDTSPLTGMFRCVMVAFAGLVVLTAFAPPAWRDRLPGPVRRRVARLADAVRRWWADGTADPLR